MQEKLDAAQARIQELEGYPGDSDAQTSVEPTASSGMAPSAREKELEAMLERERAFRLAAETKLLHEKQRAVMADIRTEARIDSIKS